MNRKERFIKPKIDKYIQLYSKKARTEEGVQNIVLTSAVILNGGKDYPANTQATITAPVSGTQPTVALTQTNGTITGAVLTTYANAIYTTPPSITITQTASTSVKSIEIVDGGTGYLTAPKIFIDPPPTIRTAVISATFNANGTQIATVSIVDGGAGYTANPTIKIRADPPDEDDFLATIVPTLTNGVITSVAITNGGQYQFFGTTPKFLTVEVSAPINNTDQAIATCTVDSTGSINTITITQQGLNYITPPNIYVENGDAVFTGYLSQGYGGNLDINYQYVASTYYKYSWDLETPIILNEHGLIQVAHREFFNIPTNDKNKLIVMRIHDLPSMSSVNTKNTGNHTDFNGGVVVDIGLENRLVSNQIILEISPQTIDRITLSLNHDISGFLGFHAQIEFLVMLKVIEKEPSMIEYGALNNLNFNQVLG